MNHSEAQTIVLWLQSRWDGMVRGGWPEGARTAPGAHARFLETLTPKPGQSQSPTPEIKSGVIGQETLLTSWESRTQANNRSDLLSTGNRARLETAFR